MLFSLTLNSLFYLLGPTPLVLEGEVCNLLMVGELLCCADDNIEIINRGNKVLFGSLTVNY